MRSVFALVGGSVHETAELVLPRLVRRSRLYEATAKNLLRVSIELVGGVEATLDRGRRVRAERQEARSAQDGRERRSSSARSRRSASRRCGCSPPAADVTHGTRVYLDAFVRGAEGSPACSPRRRDLRTVDDLLAALEGGSGTAARLIDIPPLELAALRRSLADLREPTRAACPRRPRWPRSSTGSGRRPSANARSLLEVSTGVGHRVLQLRAPRRAPAPARSVRRRPEAAPRRGIRRLRGTRRAPYGAAVARHFDPAQASFTERGIDKLRRTT